jgi:hypothetical protein
VETDRRGVLRGAALGSAALYVRPGTADASSGQDAASAASELALPEGEWTKPLDLSPARWIWYPSGRTLQNTCLLFRKTFDLDEVPEDCTGWLLAESRYKLFVNGRYVQFGPAPSDPRYSECDPLAGIRPHLKRGRNVIAVQVVYFGQGDGTWPLGKPGLICNLKIGGTTILSDSSWTCHLARSWQPGQYKRWYLRALQEERDERLLPAGWTDANFAADARWRPAAEVAGKADKPALSNAYPEYQWDVQGGPESASLRRRSVAMLEEKQVPVSRLTETAWVKWLQPPEDYFDMIVPDAFTAIRETVSKYENGACRIPVRRGHAALLTFELQEQLVGWPTFVIDAPAGTIVELLVHEAHQPGGPPIINSHFNSWTRFICREGENRFETFDFESLRWLQFHVRNYSRPVTISAVGVRRRSLPGPKPALVEVGDARVQKVVDAAINTLVNSAQETIVDGMGRERQQYSGDCGHQLHPLFSTVGETRLPGRFVNTFSQGLTKDGYFFDCWPAWDRLARVAERQLDLTPWGPILDHGIQFVFDCWNYHLYTGRSEALREAYPRLLVFFDYLMKLKGADGLLPVENLGVPIVWIDNAQAFQKQKHRQCAFNLYAAAMCEHALAPLTAALGRNDEARRVAAAGVALRRAAIARFWSSADACFVNNLPWAASEGGKRFDDRSLATAVIFDQCPGGNTKAAVARLMAMPADTGMSFPPNAVWRYWALAKAGQIETILGELRDLWMAMDSVTENNTLAEDWRPERDSNAQWSHSPMAPLIMMHMGVAGVRPTRPGYAECDIRPQPGSLGQFHIVTHTVKGAIDLAYARNGSAEKLSLRIPEGVNARLILPPSQRLAGIAPKRTGEGNVHMLKGPVVVEEPLVSN